MKIISKLCESLDKESNIIATGLQFIKFGIVGLSNTAISLGIYYILVHFGFNYVLANTIGFIVSVLNAYYWNNRVVFKKNNIKDIRALIKTFASYGFTFVLSTVLLVVLIKYLKVSELIAPIINLIITVPLNFLLNKFWTFK